MTNKRSRRATLAFLGALAGQEHRRRTQWFKQTSLYASQSLTARQVAEAFEVPKKFVPEPGESAAEWAARELQRPSSALNHRTARFAGKPYHWRQDYTGQLKLAAGESPW